MKIDASQLSHQELNDQLRMSREQNIIIDNCLGQRYLARSTFTAMSRKPPAIL